MGSPRTVRALSAEACDKRAELQSAEIQTLKKMLSESRTTFFSQLQACGQQKDAMIDHLTQSSEELQSELHERQKTVAKQVGRIHDLETALAVQTSQTEHLSKQTGHLISLLEALQEDVAEHQKTALRQANRVHELEVALAAQTSQRDHLARHADEQTNALEELRAELAAKQGTARRQALRMQELENAVAVQSSHMTVNDKPLQELQQMQMELRSKAERVQALEEFVEQQRTEIQTLNQHIDTLEDQAHTRNDVNKRLVDENTRLKGYVRLMKYSQDRPKSAIQDPPSQGLKTAAGEGASHGPWPAAPESPPPPGRTNGCHLLRSPLMTTEDLRGKQCSTDSTGFLLPPEETV